MKRIRTAQLLLLCLVVAVVSAGLVGCDTASSKETDSETMSAADSTSEPPVNESDSDTETDTDADTDTDTESESDTEAETLAPIYVIDPDNAASMPDGLFKRSLNCKATVVTDATEGRVFRLTVSSNVGGSDVKYPMTYMDLAGLAAAMNGSLPNTEEYAYLLLKVRAGDLWDRSFCLYGGADEADAKPASANALLVAHVKDTEDWQYISFRLPRRADTLYLRFEYELGSSGESIDIAEFRFVKTEAEAAALCGEDVYPRQNATLNEGDIRVISYNVWVGGSTDDNVRADILRDFLDTYQPDSIGVQEDDPEWRAAFKDRFVFNASYAGVGYTEDNDSEGCMIFYRVDKYELLDSGIFWLSDTPDVADSKFADAIYPRFCTWVHLRDRVTGQEYVHLNTHLDHKSNDVRKAQVKALLAYMAENFSFDVPMILTGDFNSTSQTSTGSTYALYKLLTGKRDVDLSDGTSVKVPFSDSRKDAAQTDYESGGTATMTKYFDTTGSDYNPEKLPIDYQFHSDLLEALVYKTVLNDRGGTLMSDHLPVICDYSFRSAE